MNRRKLAACGRNSVLQGYIDALYAYQRSLLEIDAAVGREATK